MNKLFKIFSHLAFGALFMIIISPLLWMIVSSLKPSDSLFTPTLIPSEITLSHYRKLITETNFIQYVLNSLFVGITVSFVSTALSLLCAYCYNRIMFKGKQILGWLTMLVYMVAPIMLVIPLYIIFNMLSIGNSYAALIISHIIFIFPFAFWMLNRYISELPIEIEKAAIVDGAGFSNTFFRVVIPNLAPAISSVLIFSFILSWNDYVFARILITGDARKTVPLGIEEIFNATITDWGVVMAGGVLISLPIIIAYFFAGRFLDRNLFLKYL
jgi:ABC-type glycerol-3-phosphate transport system permease component